MGELLALKVFLLRHILVVPARLSLAALDRSLGELRL